MQTKAFFKSKTIIGAVMMALAIALQSFQVEVDAGTMDQAATDLDQLVKAATGFIGFVLVIWGRIKARRAITLSGK